MTNPVKIAAAGNWVVEQSQAGLKKAAVLVTELYGERAADYAMQRIAALETLGDMTGASAWQRVLPAIERLLSEQAPDDPAELSPEQ